MIPPVSIERIIIFLIKGNTFDLIAFRPVIHHRLRRTSITFSVCCLIAWKSSKSSSGLIPAFVSAFPFKYLPDFRIDERRFNMPCQVGPESPAVEDSAD